MSTTINATQTPDLGQRMESASAANLTQWAAWADAELRQLRQVNANLETELADLRDRWDASDRDADFEDERNADLCQLEEWFPDMADRDGMLPEFLARPFYGVNVHE